MFLLSCRFSSIEVPLSGLQILKVPAADGANSGSGQQFYSVKASTHGTSELYLLTSEKSSDSMVFGPTFSGLLNVCESYGNCSANLAPQVIPASPAPSIPLGLKQRFHPFGNKAPTLNCEGESETDGAALGLLSTSLRPLGVKRSIEETWQEDGVEDKGRKKKKTKKKKEKRIKTEQEDEKVILAVKEEPDAEIHNEDMTELPSDEGLVLEERRKKKKKKKDREREDLEPSVMVKVEEVMVKCEPIDSLCSDVVEGCGKKKKKKKKSKIADD